MAVCLQLIVRWGFEKLCFLAPAALAPRPLPRIFVDLSDYIPNPVLWH